MMLSLLPLLLALGAQDADPPVPAMSPSEIVENSHPSAWRQVAPDHLLIMTLSGDREVVIELNSRFAPRHVLNIQRFAENGWWFDGTVYRVQDNYVAQWGIGDAEKDMPDGVVENPPEEYVTSIEGIRARGLGSPDSYAATAGFVDGWPVALYRDGTASLTHCYGTVGVARGLHPQTGSGSELYAIIGHAPRHLDRNIAIVGRVIDGIEHLSSLPRGSGTLGFYEANETPTEIDRVILASMLPEEERPSYEVMIETSDEFGDYVRARANRSGDFFRVPARGVDLCNVQVPIREVGED
ncbi:peptidylprolyl isomerase [Sphingomicrobium sediminis]|uniref:peptidylprolyl isomerase n=1 Tax=Sphingomicrobium sediminis TaxID=2950949 RepID=A0A9X2J3Q6_9SPHN|nr:peptidylprolyl isomerase [Sphingomicrobium sediminis]MCM8558310.1 peptidylprolyl isomerase [Sphingomicrobium sediminis]